MSVQPGWIFGRQLVVGSEQVAEILWRRSQQLVDLGDFILYGDIRIGRQSKIRNSISYRVTFRTRRASVLVGDPFDIPPAAGTD
jgi:hypothetical protein